MALRVRERAAVDVAQLLELERAQRRRAGEEALDVVQVAADVDRDALVPYRPVRRDPVVVLGHRASVA
jgi:hypothetical protein